MKKRIWVRKSKTQPPIKRPPADYCKYLAELQIGHFAYPDIDNCITCRELEDPETWERTLHHLLNDDIGFDAEEEIITFNRIEGTGRIPEDNHAGETIKKILKKKREIANRRKK